MPEKVLILEIKENYALAMAGDGAILRICRKENMAVGDSVYILPEDLYQETGIVGTLPVNPKKKTMHKGVRHLAAIAASLALLLTLLIPQFSMKAYAVVSLDAEHGMQMQVDRNHQILNAVSPDGSIPQKTLDDFKGKDLFRSGEELSRILGKGPIIVGYAPREGRKNRETEAEIRALFADQKLIYLPATSKDIEQATASSQSLGKYILGLLLAGEEEEFLQEFYHAYETEEDEESRYHEEYWSAFAGMNLDELIAAAKENPDYMRNETFRDLFSDKLEAAADALEDAADPDHEDEPDDTDDSDDEEDDDSDDEEDELPDDDEDD